MKTEYDIHDIIRTYPYLLGSKFAGLHLKHEKIYNDRSRADFVFSDGDISIVVEIKIGNIDEQTVKQAFHYLDKEKRENPQKKLLGVLVGRRAPNEQILEERVKNSSYKFEVKFLTTDIPTEIKLCDNCRMANNVHVITCKFCGSKKFIVDPFLFISHK